MKEKNKILNYGKATYELASIMDISPEALTSLVIFYKTNKMVLSERVDSPENELKKIEKALIKLQEKKWISEEGIASVAKTLFTNLNYSPETIFYDFKSQLKKVGAPRDIALDFLIYCIFSRLKKRRHYRLVMDFLDEQKIIIDNETDVKFTEENLRKKFKGLNLDLLKKLNKFWNIRDISELSFIKDLKELVIS